MRREQSVLELNLFLKERLVFLKKYEEKQRGKSFILPKESKMSEKSEEKGLRVVFGYGATAMEVGGRARG